MEFKPQCLATAIGSMPHEDPSGACRVILKNIPEIPIWPQLPNTGFREEMEIQYSEGFPCVEFDEAKQRMYFKTDVDITPALEKFYENYLADNLDYFQISPEYSRGIYAMEKALTESPPSGLQYFKSHA